MLTLANKIWIKVKSAYRRITLTKFTTAFFLLSFLHCFAQGISLAFLYTIDSSYSSVVSAIVTQAHLPTNEFAWLTRDNGGFQVQLCQHIPGSHGETEHPCQTVFDTMNKTFSAGTLSAGNSSVGTVSAGTVYERSLLEHDSAASLYLVPRSSQGTPPEFSASASGDGSVSVSFNGGESSTLLSKTCAQVLVYPNQVLDNAQREDLALISLQFWLFGISYIAIMYESVPHILAALCTHFLITAWSSYAIWRNLDISKRFQNLVLNPGTPCNPDSTPTFNFFHVYTSSRSVYEIPDLVLQAIALGLIIYLSWHLVKAYKEQTFRCVGPTTKVMRVYKFFMAFLFCLHFSVWTLTCTMGLWIDQFKHGAIAQISSHTTVYLALVIVTTIFLLPWIFMGWYSIRYEIKRLMAVFSAIGFVFIAGWALMFYSMVFRWTFVQWPFLACATVSSFIVLIGGLVLGVVCLLNFNSGLSHYLYADDTLASQDFEPELFPRDIEKGSFADNSKITPTFYIPSLHKLASDAEMDRNYEFKEAKRPPSVYSQEGSPSGGLMEVPF